MPHAVLPTILLLVIALGLLASAGRLRAMAWSAAALVWFSAVLLVLREAADSFTGEGINYAVMYHVRYGLEGAGFGEYRALIVRSLLALLAPGALLIGVAWLGRKRAPNRRRAAIAFGVAGAAVVVNPATIELAKLAHPPPPQTADFLRHYRTPRIEPTSTEHPNFVFIFAESLERTYFDEKIFPGLIKELRPIEAEATSFTDIRTVYGTGFTMGGMVAALCGVPLFTPAHPNAMSGMDAFLPGAVGLSDLLHAQGYHLAFMEGAPLTFAGKGKFLRTHHFDEEAGFSELHPRLPDRTYISNWGIYDDTMLDFAFERFTQLAQQPRPLGFFLLTLDTHHPSGHISHAAAHIRYGDGANAMLNAVAASDHLIAAFIRRIQASPEGRRTVIVLASDHIAMNNDASALLNRGTRRNLLLILDPRHPGGTKVSRAGSTLDTGTTLLPVLGFRGAIGLGRDLRDPTVSDQEVAHIEQDATLLSWQQEIEKFWDFPSFQHALTFSAARSEVTMDGRIFGAPLLAELHEGGRTTLRFEFDATYDVRLAAQADRLPAGQPFVLVAARNDALPLMKGEPVPDTSWVAVVGKSGQKKTAVPLKDDATLTRAQVDALLAR